MVILKFVIIYICIENFQKINLCNLHLLYAIEHSPTTKGLGTQQFSLSLGHD